jgi:hypothetical protein
MIPMMMMMMMMTMTWIFDAGYPKEKFEPGASEYIPVKHQTNYLIVLYRLDHTAILSSTCPMLVEICLLNCKTRLLAYHHYDLNLNERSTQILQRFVNFRIKSVV